MVRNGLVQEIEMTVQETTNPAVHGNEYILIIESLKSGPKQRQ